MVEAMVWRRRRGAAAGGASLHLLWRVGERGRGGGGMSNGEGGSSMAEMKAMSAGEAVAGGGRSACDGGVVGGPSPGKPRVESNSLSACVRGGESSRSSTLSMKARPSAPIGTCRIRMPSAEPIASITSVLPRLAASRVSCRRAGGDGWCFVRAVGCPGSSFVWVATGEPLMLAYMSQSTWVGKVEGGLGGASCMLMGRAVRQTRVATGGQASEHRARATWVNMLLCARWKVTHLFSLLRTFFPLQRALR